jgi:N-acetylmuramoyl-L-alanine amidase
VTKGAAIPQSYPGFSDTTSATQAVQVTTGVLNVRTGPGTGYAIKGQVYSGQYYISSASSGGWWKIWYDGTEGWISGSYSAAVSGVSAVQVTTDVLNVRTGPGTGYAVAGQVTSGQRYFWTQYEGLNGWYKIYWRGGSYCVHGGYVTKVPL